MLVWTHVRKDLRGRRTWCVTLTEQIRERVFRQAIELTQ